MKKTWVWKKSLTGSLILILLLAVVTACGSKDETPQSLSSAPAASGGASQKAGGAAGTGGDAIGFIFIGTKDDYGYNQAAYLGSEAVEKAFPDMKILRKENVPEDANAERVMEEMIRQGAKIIFPTSYGHLDPAINVANRHKDVVFLHQGGLKTTENVGTYMGNIWETVYLSGVAAGHMTKTNKLGYIAAIPIPQVLLNINAFTLGARSVNPEATVSAVFTGSWCDPGMQAQAANTLIDQKIDVLTQHQDCTKTIIETAESRGAMSVGYHADGSELAPNGWITAPVWDWGDVFVKMAKTVEEGKFAGSEYAGKYRMGVESGVVKLAPFGKQVPQQVQDEVLKLKDEIVNGTFHPFNAEIKDQAGKVHFTKGETAPTIEQLESTDFFVEGVIGSIPN
jgi:basic membrane protein A